MLVAISLLVVLISVLLILAILIQNPKEGGIDSSLDGNLSNRIIGASQSVEVVERWTWYVAGALFVLCLVASLLAKG
jgi:preprotein translocase subunit SecG